MKRTFLSLLLLAPLFLMAAEKPWFKGTLEEAQASAKAQNKMVVLKFYADW